MSTDAEKLKQKQKIRKYLVFTGMFLLFLGCMWLIFAPSEKDRQEAERKTGFNAELPDPKGTGIEADKMAAYEQADMIRRQEEKKRTLADFSALTDGHRQDNVPETEPAQDIASEMKAVRTIQEETAGREPSPLQPRLTTTSTPLSAVFTRVLRKTRKRKP